MHKLIVAALFAAILLGTTATGQAYERDWHGGIRARINMEYERIERGMERGSLTRPEAHRLRQELEHILQRIDRMREDGYLDPREREVINRDLDRLDWDITREKRNERRYY